MSIYFLNLINHHAQAKDDNFISDNNFNFLFEKGVYKFLFIK